MECGWADDSASTVEELSKEDWMRNAWRNRGVPLAAFGITVVVAALLSAQSEAQTPQQIRGFSAAGSAAELARERDLRSGVDAKANEADFDVMTAEPHHAGSPYEIKLADYV